eukprot:gb/GECG01015110.1/.p1 GENE.gb/GECG01015110.1/~~gb/GECG01015110.1/.p1  ORF type:complete len:310 (+),score=2.78 gb/GECG01015110.1/:1-930(+)
MEGISRISGCLTGIFCEQAVGIVTQAKFGVRWLCDWLCFVASVCVQTAVMCMLIFRKLAVAIANQMKIGAQYLCDLLCLAAWGCLQSAAIPTLQLAGAIAFFVALAALLSYILSPLIFYMWDFPRDLPAPRWSEGFLALHCWVFVMHPGKVGTVGLMSSAIILWLIATSYHRFLNFDMKMRKGVLFSTLQSEVGIVLTCSPFQHCNKTLPFVQAPCIERGANTRSVGERRHNTVEQSRYVGGHRRAGADYSTQFDCSICLSRNEGCPAYLGCGHRFHKVCIEEWLTTYGCSCPICRDAASASDICVLRT